MADRMLPTSSVRTECPLMAARTRRPLMSESMGNQLKSPVGLVLNPLRATSIASFDRRICGY